MEKEVWISVLVVVVLLVLGVFLTQKTSWFESSYNYSDVSSLDNPYFAEFPMENPSNPVDAVECSADGDCVAESCCHASSCVAKENAPICSGIKCTMDCRPGSLDCGGSCLCENGKCVAKLAG